MQHRLSSRSALALTIYFAMVTSVCAPLAFYAGKARGENEADALANASLIGTDTTPDYASLIRAQRAGADCDPNDPGVERRGPWEVFCHPYTEGGGEAGTIAQHLAAAEKPDKSARSQARSSQARSPQARNANSQQGPLQKAVLRALAQGDGAQGGAGETAPYPGDPFSLALAPIGGGSGVGAGAVPPSGGFPGILIPNYPAPGQSTPPVSEPPLPPGPPQNPPEPPPPGPPVLVTPLPAALPLMIAGFGGLFAASRRRR